MCTNHSWYCVPHTIIVSLTLCYAYSLYLLTQSTHTLGELFHPYIIIWFVFSMTNNWLFTYVWCLAGTLHIHIDPLQVNDGGSSGNPTVSSGSSLGVDGFPPNLPGPLPVDCSVVLCLLPDCPDGILITPRGQCCPMCVQRPSYCAGIRCYQTECFYGWEIYMPYGQCCPICRRAFY